MGVVSPGNCLTDSVHNKRNILFITDGHERAELIIALMSFSTKNNKLVYGERKKCIKCIKNGEFFPSHF